MMWFLFLIAALAYATKPYDLVPIYRNELRHLPEKLKQERIRETINNTFTLIQDQVIQAAIRNETETNFTLFCLEPNVMQKKYNLYRKQGSTYVLLDQEEYDRSYNNHLETFPPELIRLKSRPRCSVKDGYELYKRHGGVVQPYSPDHPYYVPLDFTARQKQRGAVPNLEQEPILYVQHFFELFNQHFRELTLVISHERKSEMYEGTHEYSMYDSHKKTEGIFETECCPVYIVSW